MSNIRQKQPGQFGNQNRRSISRQRTSGRLAGVWLVLGLASLGLLWRLCWLQIVRAPFLQSKAQAQQTTVKRPFVPRRTIVDRADNQMAIDTPSYSLYVYPAKFSEVLVGKGFPKNGKKVKLTSLEVAQRLAPILQCDVQKLVEKFNAKKFNRPQSRIFVESGLQENVKDSLNSLKLDGLETAQGDLEYTRFYPQNDAFAEVVGYLDWEHKAQAGVELSQSSLLERNLVRYRVTKTGGKQQSILPDRVTSDYLHSDDLKLKLTVDLRLQRAARKALVDKMKEWNAQRGTVIVMDAETGAIRALVVAPTYDPNHYARDVENYSKNKNVGKLRAPLLLQNSSVSDLYEPGSTFKPIAVAIALENQAIVPTSQFNDEGSIRVGTDIIRNSDKKGHGKIDVAQILQHSSNVGMVKMMQRLKPNAYYDWLQRIGLGQKSGIDLPLEGQGKLISRREFVASPIYPANTAFGQGFSLTPIQLVRLIGSIANGGKLVTPYVVEGLFDSEGVRKDNPVRPEPSQIFTPQNAQAVLEMMETVVAKGSGDKAKIAGYRIAGKTGTSQKAGMGGYTQDDKKVTSFVGILPVDRQRRYVVFAAIDEPKGKEKAFGSNVAAPIVKLVMDSLISIEGIAPSNPSEIVGSKTDRPQPAAKTTTSPVKSH
jgi:cell division protein FtsI (penicillin-binding protein 3)